MWALSLLLVISAIGSLHAQTFKRVCYITNWSQYRGDVAWWPEDIDAFLCTHILFSFAGMEGNYLTTTEWNDEDLYARTVAKKNENPNLKVLLAVGGGGFDLTKMTAMLSTWDNRNAFIMSSIDYLRQRGFDGLDLDFEYPGTAPSIPEDKQRFTFLCEEARVAFDNEGAQTGRAPLLLTAAVSGGKWAIDPGYEVPQLSQALDFINIMTYDFHGNWEYYTGFNSPLWARAGEENGQEQLNVHWAATYWIQLGAAASKLVIGTATYARCWQLTDPNQNGVGAPAVGPCQAGDYTGSAGILAYYEVCTKVNDATWTKVYAADQEYAYMYKGDQWIGYDDIRSFQAKVDYIQFNSFGPYGGAMVWDMDLDDFDAQFCGQGRYPLITQHTAMP